MIHYNCRMCGGPLPVTAEPIVECEYCGSRQPVPSADSEKKQTLFARANRLRLACEFDRAAAVYESIAAEFPEETEASWGIVLCRYGIEYVDDPATGKKVPTCHRSSFASVLEDADYQLTLDNADPMTRKLYHREAAHIEELREGILSVSASEKPYDIFICYKETDERGDRTLDSVLAQDLYDLLTGKGYRVFFSRISLEDKLGRDYEPYIFAALNSAKVMLAVGTCFEHYDAVWVKNEWSRFLKLMEQDREKYLIPCYKDIDAYDMPKEFRKLQAQDLGKVGAHQDLVRGIEKLIEPKSIVEPVSAQTAPQQIVIQQGAANSVDALVKRGFMALEDGEWEKAESFFNDSLNQDAELAEAYWGLVLANTQCTNSERFIQAMSSPSDLRAVSIQAVKPDKERVDAAIQQYTIPDYLSEERIQKLYQFDLSVPSQVIPYKEFVSQTQKTLSDSNDLRRARQYASNELRQHLNSVLSQIDEIIKQRTKKYSDAELLAKQSKRSAYVKHLAIVDQKIQNLHANKLARKENEEAARRERDRIKNAEEKEKKRNILIIASVIILIIVAIATVRSIENDRAIAELRADLVGGTIDVYSTYSEGFAVYHEYWKLTFIDENTVDYYYLRSRGPKGYKEELDSYGPHSYSIYRALSGDYKLRVKGHVFTLEQDPENKNVFKIHHSD